MVREVTQVISKGTMVDLEFLDANDFNYLGSILDLEYAYLLTYADISTVIFIVKWLLMKY